MEISIPCVLAVAFKSWLIVERLCVTLPYTYVLSAFTELLYAYPNGFVLIYARVVLICCPVPVEFVSICVWSEFPVLTNCTLVTDDVYTVE